MINMQRKAAEIEDKTYLNSISRKPMDTLCVKRKSNTFERKIRSLLMQIRPPKDCKESMIIS